MDVKNIATAIKAPIKEASNAVATGLTFYGGYTAIKELTGKKKALEAQLLAAKDQKVKEDILAELEKVNSTLDKIKADNKSVNLSNDKTYTELLESMDEAVFDEFRRLADSEGSEKAIEYLKPMYGDDAKKIVESYLGINNFSKKSDEVSEQVAEDIASLEPLANPDPTVPATNLDLKVVDANLAQDPSLAEHDSKPGSEPSDTAGVQIAMNKNNDSLIRQFSRHDNKELGYYMMFSGSDNFAKIKGAVTVAKKAGKKAKGFLDELSSQYKSGRTVGRGGKKLSTKSGNEISKALDNAGASIKESAKHTGRSVARATGKAVGTIEKSMAAAQRRATKKVAGNIEAAGEAIAHPIRTVKHVRKKLDKKVIEPAKKFIEKDIKQTGKDLKAAGEKLSQVKDKAVAKTKEAAKATGEFLAKDAKQTAEDMTALAKATKDAVVNGTKKGAELTINGIKHTWNGTKWVADKAGDAMGAGAVLYGTGLLALTDRGNKKKNMNYSTKKYIVSRLAPTANIVFAKSVDQIKGPVAYLKHIVKNTKPNSKTHKGATRLLELNKSNPGAFKVVTKGLVSAKNSGAAINSAVKDANLINKSSKGLITGAMNLVKKHPYIAAGTAVTAAGVGTKKYLDKRAAAKAAAAQSNFGLIGAGLGGAITHYVSNPKRILAIAEASGKKPEEVAKIIEAIRANRSGLTAGGALAGHALTKNN